MRTLSSNALIGVSLIALAMPASVMAQADTAAVPATASSVDPAAPVTTGATAPVPQAAAPAAAQALSPDSDIIVTARRREESIQDVPAVVNAVTAAEVAKLNLRDFQEVSTIVPGLSLSSNSNGTGGNAQLRGVNFDINASGQNPTVEFYQNDAPITAGVVLQQLYDIGQIEVLRGPQGTLRGRASPSGSITVTTRKPDLYKAGGYTNLTGNTIGTLNFNGGLGVPIIEGIAAIRVAGLINEDEGNRVKTVNPRIDGRDPYTRTYSGRVSALVTPFDALRLEGSFQRLDRRSRQFDQVESFNQVNPGVAASPITIRAEDRLSSQETPRTIHQKYDIYNGRAELALGGQRLIYQFQHYTQLIDSNLGQDYGNVFPNYDYGYFSGTNVKSTSHELRLQNEERVFGAFDYVLGVFDNKNSSPSDLLITTPVFLPAALGGGLAATVTTPVGRRGKTHEQSVFGNLTAHIGQSTEVSGGLRYIDYQSSGTLIQPGVVLPDPSIKDNKLIYSASIKHNFTREFMVYASTGSSYRAAINAIGDFSVRRSALENSFINLPPETSKSYEAGFKTTLMDGKLRFNASAFHQKFDNFVFRSPGVNGQSGVYYINYNQTTNAGVTTVTPQVGQFNFVAAVPVTVNGVEGELAFDVGSRLKLNLISSYALGKIKNGTIPCNDLNGDGIPDVTVSAPSVAQLAARVGANNLSSCTVTQRSSFQPPLSATLQAEYGMPVTDGTDVYIRGLASYFGKSQSDPSNIYDNVKQYAMVNLFAGIRDPNGNWEISLFAKNLFDTVRVLSRTDPLSSTYQVLQPPTFRSAAAVTTTSTYTGITTTPPREFGLNARFSFGSH
ncbi:TonB-dependent receptor [Sphingomonas sp. R86520]|uniref:TonB-dependent receptor n=1 Tax=Sphingomonas sp. R86520 TaxID=3093859 RepID=UPI0036D21185